MADFGRRVEERQGRANLRPGRQADLRAGGGTEPRGAVQPGTGSDEATATLPQLLGVSGIGAAVLYFSLKAGWRAGSIFGLALVVLPLIEAMVPGFIGRFIGAAEKIKQVVYAVGAVVVVCALAVLAWTGLTQPRRLTSASHPAYEAVRRMQAAPRHLPDGAARPQFYKQGRPMPADGPGSERYVRRLQ